MFLAKGTIQMNFEKDQYYSPGKKCSICRKWSGEILSSKNGINVVSCSECGLFYVDAIPLTDEEREVQNRLAAELGSTYLH